MTTPPPAAPDIDAHLHVWRPDAPWHGWPAPDQPRLYRSVTLDDARRAMGDARPNGVVLVQAQTDDRETDWLLDVAAGDPLVAGVVGWVALDSLDAPARIAALAARGGLVGLRPMLQSIADTGWLLRDDLIPAIRAMLDHGLAFDALVQPRHLGVLTAFADRWPSLRIVIDHAAKPSATPPEGWADAMADLARRPQLWCKCSGLRTEQPPGEAADALQPVVDHILARFGDRVMWGSDWPVLDEAGDGYLDWLATTQRLTAALTPEARAWLMGGAARAFYRLSDGRTGR